MKKKLALLPDMGQMVGSNNIFCSDFLAMMGSIDIFSSTEFLAVMGSNDIFSSTEFLVKNSKKSILTY